MSSPKAGHAAALVIFAVALIARVGFSFARDAVAQNTGLEVGSDGYELIAENLVTGQGYCFRPDLAETLSRPPGYPFFLAAVFWVFDGLKLWPVQLTQALFGALTAYMTYLLVLPLGRPAAILGGLIFAIYPGDLVACSRYLAEPLSMVALMGAMLLIRRLLDRPDSLFLGLALGSCFLVMVLSRDINFVLPVLLLVAAVALPNAKGHRRAFLKVAVFALVPAIVGSSLWCWRNYRLSGMVVFPSSNTGSTAFDGLHIGRYLGSGRTVRELMRESRLLQCEIARAHGIYPELRFAVFFKDSRDEAHLNRILRKEVTRSVISQPWVFLKRSALGMARFWYLGPSPRVSWVAAALNVPLLFFAIVGIWRTIRLRHHGAVLWLVVIMYYNVACAIVNPLVRYALPTIPFLAALAGLALSMFWQKSPHRSTPPASEGSAVDRSSRT